MSNRRIIRRSGVFVCMVETLRQERYKDEKEPRNNLRSLRFATLGPLRIYCEFIKATTVCNSKAQVSRLSLNLFGIWNKPARRCANSRNVFSAVPASFLTLRRI